MPKVDAVLRSRAAEAAAADAQTAGMGAVGTCSTDTAGRRGRGRPRKPAGAARGAYRTAGSLSRQELKEAIQHEIEKVLLTTLRKPAFKRQLAENPGLLLDFKRLADRYKPPPVRSQLEDFETFQELVSRAAREYPAQLVDLMDPKGRAKIKEVLDQRI